MHDISDVLLTAEPLHLSFTCIISLARPHSPMEVSLYFIAESICLCKRIPHLDGKTIEFKLAINSNFSGEELAGVIDLTLPGYIQSHTLKITFAATQKLARKFTSSWA